MSSLFIALQTMLETMLPTYHGHTGDRKVQWDMAADGPFSKLLGSGKELDWEVEAKQLRMDFQVQRTAHPCKRS